MSDEEYQLLQLYLIAHPESGDLMPGTGGCRKLRWRVKGRGKSGGLRVIYYYRNSLGEIWMLTIYAKNEAENLPQHLIRKLREEIDK